MDLTKKRYFWTWMRKLRKGKIEIPGVVVHQFHNNAMCCVSDLATTIDVTIDGQTIQKQSSFGWLAEQHPHKMTLVWFQRQVRMTLESAPIFNP